MTAATKKKRRKKPLDLEELGISPEQAKHYRAMAGIPQEVIDAYHKHVAGNRHGEEDTATTEGLFRFARQHRTGGVPAEAMKFFHGMAGDFIEECSQKRPAPKARRAIPNLDSVIARIEERHVLTISRESCERVAACGFRGDNLLLAIVATDLLYCEQPVTLRGLMYRVVSAGWLPSTDRVHYTRIGRLLTRLREAGVVPFNWIVDGVRSTDKPSSWSGLADYAGAVRDSYRLDFWARLPHYIHFIVEKDAVAGTLAPVTREYDVALSPIRGYSSLSFAHQIASEWNDIDKPIYCYFMGDFDASGFDLERDIREKLTRYCDKLVVDTTGAELGWCRESVEMTNSVMFHRIAVVESDFDDFDLLALAVKDSDNRAKNFRLIHGDRCAELDANPSTELRRRVRETIESHITNRDEWERLKRVEEAERDTLATVIAGMGGTA